MLQAGFQGAVGDIDECVRARAVAVGARQAAGGGSAAVPSMTIAMWRGIASGCSRGGQAEGG
ncbi:hypothetical protein ABIE67_000983 [Streptomyces sp. V4I8]|uniref:hypothetical protein n=1 Tax=Streptomyces sp. V4I8 TaxID=3156469 RepID=UPI003514D0B6